MAEASCADTKIAGVAASKKYRTIRFKAILPTEIPRPAIESQVADKVSGNCFPHGIYFLAVANVRTSRDCCQFVARKLPMCLEGLTIWDD